MTYDLVIGDGTVVSPELVTFEADVGIDGESIAAIAAPGRLSGRTEIDASGKHVLPGAIDPHTHHGIYRGLDADAETESRSNLVGGVTTIGNYFRRAGSYEEIMDGYFAEAEPNYYHDYFFSLGLLSYEHVEEIPYVIEDPHGRRSGLVVHLETRSIEFRRRRYRCHRWLAFDARD